MLDLSLNLPRGRHPSVLLVGAHADDIEIGCGGAVLRILRRYPRAQLRWVVLSSNKERAREARRASRALCGKSARLTLEVCDFRESHFPSQVPAIKAYFENLKAVVSPDLIFSHHGGDLHQDHRVVSEVMWNTFRNHFILEYEIPKYDGGLGSPTVFMPLDRKSAASKVRVLMRAFKSQHAKAWFTEETFMALMRIRGIECNANDGYAEAFYVRKALLAP